MSLRLLLDEDTQAKRLVRGLRDDEHDVLTATEAGLAGKSDLSVLKLADELARVLLTRNADDFLELTRTEPTHGGVIAIYADRGLSYSEIRVALKNLEGSGLALGGSFIALNAWYY